MDHTNVTLLALPKKKKTLHYRIYYCEILKRMYVFAALLALSRTAQPIVTMSATHNLAFLLQKKKSTEYKFNLLH